MRMALFLDGVDASDFGLQCVLENGEGNGMGS